MAGRGGAGRSFLSMKIDEKKRMQESVSGHRTGLPERLLRLFAPRKPLPPHKAPAKKPPKLPYTGVAAYVAQFAEAGDPEYEPPPPETRPPEPRVFANPELPSQARVDIETKLEKDMRLRQERQAAAAAAQEENVKGWDPAKDPNVEGDPFKTLFVSRLSFDVTERKLRREFEEYGPIKRIRLVHDKNSGKPRGYAFVEFEHKNDMKQAYKMADGRKIENKRVLVDVERGRTVPTWRPRRLGGGKGGESRVVPRPPKSIKKQFLARLMERALAEKQRAERQETEKEREREPRDRSRERAALERSKDRSRDREEGERKQERSRSRDRRPRSRDRDYERRGSGKRERDERYDDGDRDRRYSSSAKRPRERDL